MTRILGIETSCDEASAAVLEGDGDQVAQKSLVILSQDVPRVFGGVVPEIAARAHLTSIVPVVERAIEEAAIKLDDLDAVAVTNTPGLVGALLVGVSYGKALAFSRTIPLLGIHHMEGHLFAAALEHREAVPPFTALLISGGRTLLLDVEEWGKYRLLGATRGEGVLPAAGGAGWGSRVQPDSGGSDANETRPRGYHCFHTESPPCDRQRCNDRSGGFFQIRERRASRARSQRIRDWPYPGTR